MFYWHSEIIDITHGEGVHVVLHNGSQILTQRSVDVVAHGGHFVYFGKADELEKLQNGFVRPESLRENISFNTVNVQRLTYESPKLIQRLLLEIVALLDGERLSDVCSIQPLPIQSVPRLLQQHGPSDKVGKVVVQIVPEQRVTPTKIFAENGSYLLVGGVR